MVGIMRALPWIVSMGMLRSIFLIEEIHDAFLFEL